MKNLFLFGLMFLLLSCSDGSDQNTDRFSNQFQYQLAEQSYSIDANGQSNIFQSNDNNTENMENNVEFQNKDNEEDKQNEDTANVGTEIDTQNTNVQPEKITAMYGYLQGNKCKDGHVFNGMHIYVPTKIDKLSCGEINSAKDLYPLDLFINTSAFNNGLFKIITPGTQNYAPNSSHHEINGCHNCNLDNIPEASVRLSHDGKRYYLHDGTVIISNLKNISDGNWTEQESIQVKIDGSVTIDGDNVNIKKTFLAQPCEKLWMGLVIECRGW